MVAITVILAAVIAAFVFGMAGTTQTTKTVSLTVTMTTDEYGKITINGGSDLPSLNDLQYSIDGGKNWVGLGSGVGESTYDDAYTVGLILYTDVTIKGEGVQLKGTFDDGSEQVLITKQF